MEEFGASSPGLGRLPFCPEGFVEVSSFLENLLVFFGILVSDVLNYFFSICPIIL